MVEDPRAAARAGARRAFSLFGESEFDFRLWTHSLPIADGPAPRHHAGRALAKYAAVALINCSRRRPKLAS